MYNTHTVKNTVTGEYYRDAAGNVKVMTQAAAFGRAKLLTQQTGQQHIIVKR